ncbi:hypothetical protein FB451DRAFT_1172008 [Mycena latifolia]|nr:hypothetical protein FB451DRAFT_1172008 [Mycena latifolia]
MAHNFGLFFEQLQNHNIVKKWGPQAVQCTAVKDCNQHENGNPVCQFPQIGGLAAHLLISDYIGHREVSLLTPKEMGQIIFQINASSLKGLHCLRYIVDMPEQVEDVLEELYNFLEAELTLEEKRLINFRLVMIEHALCK